MASPCRPHHHHLELQLLVVAAAAAALTTALAGTTGTLLIPTYTLVDLLYARLGVHLVVSCCVLLSCLRV